MDSEVKMRMNSLPDIVLETAVIRLMSPQIDASADDKTRLERLEAMVQDIKNNPSANVVKPVISSTQPTAKKAIASTTPQEKKPEPKKTVDQPVNKNSEAGWTKVLNAIRDESGYLYPYAKQMRLAEEKAGVMTFYVPEGTAFTFLIQSDNHKHVEEHLKATFGEQVTLIVKPEKRTHKDVPKAALFGDDMFGGQEIKEI